MLLVMALSLFLSPIGHTATDLPHQEQDTTKESLRPAVKESKFLALKNQYDLAETPTLQQLEESVRRHSSAIAADLLVLQGERVGIQEVSRPIQLLLRREGPRRFEAYAPSELPRIGQFDPYNIDWKLMMWDSEAISLSTKLLMSDSSPVELSLRAEMLNQSQPEFYISLKESSDANLDREEYIKVTPQDFEKTESWPHDRYRFLESSGEKITKGLADSKFLILEKKSSARRSLILKIPTGSAEERWKFDSDGEPIQQGNRTAWFGTATLIDSSEKRTTGALYEENSSPEKKLLVFGFPPAGVASTRTLYQIHGSTGESVRLWFELSRPDGRVSFKPIAGHDNLFGFTLRANLLQEKDPSAALLAMGDRWDANAAMDFGILQRISPIFVDRLIRQVAMVEPYRAAYFRKELEPSKLPEIQR